MTAVGGPGGPGGTAGPAADDAALLRAHVAGDPDAFGELVRRHTPRLWAVAVRTLRDPDDAADALQDAMVSAYRGAASYRGDAQVTTWLHRIVVNACLDRLRRAKARPTVPLPEHHDVPAAADDHDRVLTRLDLVEALERLPEAQRTAIVLVDLHDLPVSEAAAVLGVAEGTVKSRCSRGRAALAELLRPGHAGGAAAEPTTTGGNRSAGAGVRPPDVAASGDDPGPAPDPTPDAPVEDRS